MAYPARKIETLLGDVKKASRRINSVRMSAKSQAVETIRSLEKQLQSALNGETLRGMPEIAPRFHGVHLRGSYSKRLDWERDHLILTNEGKIQIVKYTHRGTLHLSSPQDENFRAEDLEPVTRAIQAALESHLARVEQTTQTYEQISAFAERLSSAVGYKL